MSIIKHVTLQKIVAHDFRYDSGRISRKSNNLVVQQPFKRLWSRLLLYDLEPSQALFALRFKSLLMTLLSASGEFYRSSLLLRISLRQVPTLLTCPAWETLLVAILPPA